MNTYLRQLVAQADLKDLYVVGLYTRGELSCLSPTANMRSVLAISPYSPWSPPDWVLHPDLAESF